jgi:hypothetical protein
MKSSIKQLENRGFVSDVVLKKYKNISDEKIIKFLNSPLPSDRTLGAKASILRKSDRILPVLCKTLLTEKKLYTKIALSEAIEKYGIPAMKYLLPLLGKIGKNQHKKIALVDINKKSYPLPRDLAARIIIRIGDSALPFLEEILISGEYIQKLEAIDAIGHISFNFNQYRSEKNLHDLLKQNSDDELIVWKIIRAYQSFISREVENRLNKIIKENKNEIFVEEAKRSLRQIEKRRIKNF